MLYGNIHQIFRNEFIKLSNLNFIGLIAYWSHCFSHYFTKYSHLYLTLRERSFTHYSWGLVLFFRSMNLFEKKCFTEKPLTIYIRYHSLLMLTYRSMFLKMATRNLIHDLFFSILEEWNVSDSREFYSLSFGKWKTITRDEFKTNMSGIHGRAHCRKRSGARAWCYSFYAYRETFQNK